MPQYLFFWAFATSCYYHRRIGITARKLPSGQITIWIRTPTAGFLIPPTTKAPRLTSHVFHAYITVYKRNIATNSSKFRSRQRISRTKFEKKKKKRNTFDLQSFGPLTNTRKAEDNSSNVGRRTTVPLFRRTALPQSHFSIEGTQFHP